MGLPRNSWYCKRKWINPLGYEKLSIAHDLNRGLFCELSKNRGLSNYRETSKNCGLSGNHEIPGRKIKLGWQTNQLVYAKYGVTEDEIKKEKTPTYTLTGDILFLIFI